VINASKGFVSKFTDFDRILDPVGVHLGTVKKQNEFVFEVIFVSILDEVWAGAGGRGGAPLSPKLVYL